MRFKDTYERVTNYTKANADGIGAALSLVTIIPFISLGYLGIWYLVSIFMGNDTDPANPTIKILASDLVSLSLIPTLTISLFTALLIFYTRKYYLFLAIINCFLLWALLNTSNITPEAASGAVGIEGKSAIIISFYIFSALCTIFMVLAKGSLSYFLCILVVLCIFLESLFSIMGSHVPIFASIFNGYVISPINALTTIFFIFLIRGIKKFSEENNLDNDTLNPKQRSVARKKTWNLWWPMLAIFGFLTLGNALLQYFVVTPAIIEEIDRDRLGLDANQSPAARGEPLKPEMVSLSISEAINRSFDSHGKATKDQIDSLADEITKHSEKSADNVIPFARSKMPNRFPGTRTRSCSWYNVVCHIKNGIKSMINSGYVSARESLLNETQLKINEAKQNNQDHNAAAAAYLKAQSDLFVQESKRKVLQTSTALVQISILLFVYSLLILGKSYLIVFARVFYAIDKNSISASGEADVKTTTGRVSVKSNKYEISESEKEAIYLTFDVVGANTIDRRRVPQPFSIFLPRVLRGKYLLNKVDMADGVQIGSCDVKVDPPNEIIRWEIKPDEEVFINIRDLIGFSEGCTLGRRVSLHISSLVFGRIIYHYVRGPGQIFLKSNSTAIVGNSEAANSTMHASSLMAWNRNAEFNVKSSLTKTDVFFSGYSIAKVPLKRFQVAYDTSQSRRVKSGRGIWRLILTFLLPI